jgi:hypothetical protein
MNVFIPVETTWSEAGCLIVVGSGAVEAGDPQSSALELAEMASSDTAGTVEVDIGAGGKVQLVARVVDPIAAEKCRRNVYSGFAITTLAAADGSQRVRRVALVDSPSGFSKTLLKISKGSNMHKARPAILCDPRQVALTVREARDRKTEASRITKAANPPPAGVARPAGEDQWQGTGTTGGGKGRDRASYGCDQGTDAAMQAVRAALGNPYREAGGLVTMLSGRHA